jgi:hypothetical protein
MWTTRAMQKKRRGDRDVGIEWRETRWEQARKVDRKCIGNSENKKNERGKKETNCQRMK